MHISFVGHHLDVTPALKAFTEEKLGKLERHVDMISSIHVVFSLEKLNQVVEATVKVGKAEIHARSEAEDMYAAVDGLIGKLDKQLIKHKEKVQDKREHREKRDLDDE